MPILAGHVAVAPAHRDTYVAAHAPDPGIPFTGVRVAMDDASGERSPC